MKTVKAAKVSDITSVLYKYPEQSGEGFLLINGRRVYHPQNWDQPDEECIGALSLIPDEYYPNGECYCNEDIGALISLALRIPNATVTVIIQWWRHGSPFDPWNNIEMIEFNTNNIVKDRDF